jgi:hypothetical protein
VKETRRVVAGWSPQGSVRVLIQRHEPAWAELPYVLIASVDSDTDVGDMPWARERLSHEPEWAISTSPLVISGRDAVELLRGGRVSFGFDEVWIPAGVPISAPPHEAYLVAPRRLAHSVPPPVAEWMEASGCRLGLGDGDGLNFVAADLELASSLGLPVT